jgi:hypothetical protein
MAFSDEEKARSRHHLGYLNVGLAATFALGVPAAVQTQFLIESAFEKVLPSAEAKVRELLTICDEYEAQWRENKDLRDVNQVGEIQIRPDAFEAQVKEYMYWRAALGNAFGVPPNPYDMRFGSMASNKVLNIPVQH